MCSKLTIETPELRQSTSLQCVFIVKLKQIQYECRSFFITFCQAKVFILQSNNLLYR